MMLNMKEGLAFHLGRIFVTLACLLAATQASQAQPAVGSGDKRPIEPSSISSAPLGEKAIFDVPAAPGRAAVPAASGNPAVSVVPGGPVAPAPAPQQPGVPLRCASTKPDSSHPTSFCVRQVAVLPSGQLRVVTHFRTEDGAAQPAVAVRLDGTQLSPSRAELFAGKPFPLHLVLMIQLTEQRMPLELIASIRELIETAFRAPESAVGFVAYERNRRILLRLPLTSNRADVFERLTQLAQLTAKPETTRFSLSDAFINSMDLIEQQPLRPPAMGLIVALTSGAEDTPSEASTQVFGGLAARALRADTVVDVLFFKSESERRERPSKGLVNIANQTGGLVFPSASLDELSGKTRMYTQQVLGQQQATELTFAPRAIAGTDRHHVEVNASKEAGMPVSLDLAFALPDGVRSQPEPPDPVHETPPKPVQGSSMWWWFTAILLAAALGLLLVPSVRVAIRLAFGEVPAVSGGQAPPLHRTLNMEPTPTVRAAAVRRPAAPRRPVEWVEGYPPGQSHVAWLLALDSGRVYFIDRPDIVLGNDPVCDIFIAGAPPIAFRCRLIREPSSRQMAIYPQDGTIVEHRGQRLTSPSYVFDQDELIVGTCRFRYFETRMTLS